MKMPYETTVDYSCGACKARGVKLWRSVHGCKMDGHELLCAACVAPPGTFVDDDGKGVNEHAKAFGDPDCFLKRPTVCVGRGLPAIPVDDTFYGHTSVPPEGFEWWRTLPTYGSQP